MCQAERLVVAIVLVLTSCYCSYANEESKDNTKLFRLSTSTNVLDKTSLSDSMGQGLSEQGLHAFLGKNYDAAEMYYKAALQNAMQNHIQDKNLIVLMTNLASTYREMGQYDQAQGLYKKALAESQKFKLSASDSGYKYALRQYCGLLVKTGHEDQAERALRVTDGGNNYIMQQSSPTLDAARSSSFAEGISNSSSRPFNLRIPQIQFNMRSGTEGRFNSDDSTFRAQVRQSADTSPSDASASGKPSAPCVRPAIRVRQMREERMRNLLNQKSARIIEPESDDNGNAE